MSSRYATETDVPTDRSRGEIERTLTRYGADAFTYAWDRTRAAIGFQMHGRRIRLLLPLPERSSVEFTRTATGRPRSATAAEAQYEQAVRQRWRVLALVVKAKLEAVEAGVVTFEDEWLAHTVLPSGLTVAEEVGVQVANAYATGAVSPLQIGSGS